MKFNTKKLLATTIIAMSISLPSISQADEFETIADELYSNKELSKTKEFVEKAGMAPYFGEAQVGEYTLFAPSDSAYKELSDDEIKFMQQNKNTDKLQDLLAGHIVANKLNVANLEDNQRMLTVNDDKIKIDKEGDEIYVDGAKVVDVIDLENGVIYVIDDIINDDFLDALEDLAYLED